jgi:hypothetical protein
MISGDDGAISAFQPETRLIAGAHFFADASINQLGGRSIPSIAQYLESLHDDSLISRFAPPSSRRYG